MRCVRVRGRRCQVPNSTTERRRGFRCADRSRVPLSAVLLCQRCRPPSLLPSFPSGWRSIDWALSVPHYMRVPFPFVPTPLQVSYSSSSHRRVRSVKYWLCPKLLAQTNQACASSRIVGLSTAFCRARSAPFLASPPSSPSHSLWSF